MDQYKKQLSEIIESVIAEGGSDLHLSEGKQPVIRVSGFLIPLLKRPKISHDEMMGFISVLMSPVNKEIFLKDKEIDFSYSYSEQVRFRGNGYVQQSLIGVALRLIPKHIKTIKELNLPPVLETFADKKQGFFLVVGPVGQGKTTTLAAMIDKINSERSERIITIEDPIEYIFEPKKSLIDQREVRIDTANFHVGLRGVFRQDVNVIMLGEMREPETMSTAVTAAETGHLVYSTLHTNNAAQSIDRILDSFPAHQQGQIRVQLAGSLIGIFSQRLIPRISGGLVPAYELLIVNNAVSNLIRERRTHEINTVIETGSGDGMVDMNRCLAELVRSGEITVENAYRHSTNPKILEKMM